MFVGLHHPWVAIILGITYFSEKNTAYPPEALRRLWRRPRRRLDHSRSSLVSSVLQRTPESLAQKPFVAVKLVMRKENPSACRRLDRVPSRFDNGSRPRVVLNAALGVWVENDTKQAGFPE